MIFYLAAWAVLLVVCLAVGASALTLFSRFDAFERPADRCLAMAWIGLLTLTNAFLALSLVLPLRPHWCALTALGLSLPALLLPKARCAIRECWSFARLPLMAGIGLVALSMAWFVLRGSLLTDARIYHIPRVRWFSEYGTVYGLALLEPHLALTTAWHTLTAAFDAGFVRGRVYALANGFACTLFSLNFILVARRLVQGILSLSDCFLGITSLIYFSIFIRAYSQITFSPSPDVIVVFSIVMACWMLLTAKDQSDNISPAFLFAVSTVGLKLVTAPLAFIVVITNFWSCRKSTYLLFSLSFILVLYTSPFLIVQFVSSGFPLYPTAFFDMGVNWAIDKYTMEYVAKLPSFTAPFGFDPSPGVGEKLPTTWLAMWLSLYNNQFYFLCLSFINIIVTIFLIFILKVKSSVLTTATIGLIGNVFILSAGPDIRYGLGYLYIGTSIAISYFLYTYLKSIKELLKNFLDIEIIYALLLIITLRFFPFRLHTSLCVLSLVAISGLLLKINKTVIVYPNFSRLTANSVPIATSVILASCIAASACAKDALEMAIELYNKAGLLHVPDNPVSKLLIPPPTLRFHLEKGDLRVVNTRYEKLFLAGLTYTYPVEGQCVDVDPPCSHYGIRPDIRPRDVQRGLSAGFTRAR